jgi:hypothetical protein
VLINRERPYRGEGKHALTASIGGSAGHGGFWFVDVEEGEADDNGAGRRWVVDVTSLNEANTQRQREKEHLNQAREIEKIVIKGRTHAMVDELIRERTLELIAHEAPLRDDKLITCSELATIMHKRQKTVFNHLIQLVCSGKVEKVKTTRRNGNKGGNQGDIDGYRIPTPDTNTTNGGDGKQAGDGNGVAQSTT